MKSQSIHRDLVEIIDKSPYISKWVDISNGKFDVDDSVVNALEKIGDYKVLVRPPGGSTRITRVSLEVINGTPMITSLRGTNFSFGNEYILNSETGVSYARDDLTLEGQILVIRNLEPEDIGFKVVELSLALDVVEDYEPINPGHFENLCRQYGRSQALTQALDFMNENGYTTEFLEIRDGLTAADLNKIIETDSDVGPRLTEQRGKESREKVLVSSDTRPKRYLLRSKQEITERSEYSGLETF